MTRLKVVALISGGKDSLFSILHCIANGHDVVALANLHPALEDLQEDTDSFMYQTIGHKVIPLYEQTLGLPLYRQAIHGTAVDQGRSYGRVSDIGGEAMDETESLVPLLRKVQSAHPDVNAVSTGAILSDYQRTRVEAVAIRLGLVPLSYLWQYPILPPQTQTSLLEDMANVGQDARIIKVASGGLDDSFLWQNVADRRTVSRLIKASMLFGSANDGAALGEGGEYETLAVDGPAPLWKARITIDETARQIAAGEAGSASVRILDAQVAKRMESNSQMAEVRIPKMLEDRFEQLLRSLTAAAPSQDDAVNLAHVHASQSRQDRENISLWVCTLRNDSLFIVNAVADGRDASEQTRNTMLRITGILAEHEHSFADVTFAVIRLRSMTDFTAVNAVYGSYFKTPNPPARVTIAPSGQLPGGASVMLSITSVRRMPGTPRDGLHVQSRSYWAPANIGPYSQAISVLRAAPETDAQASGVVYIAGQIPLVPATMDLVAGGTSSATESFGLQAILSLQHLHRIGERMHVQRWPVAVAYITATSPEEAISRGSIVKQIWDSFHRMPAITEPDQEESADFDVWHLKHGTGARMTRPHVEEASHAATTYEPEQAVPPIYVVRVNGLPRGVSVEWASIGFTSASSRMAPDAEQALDQWLQALDITRS